jgi:hypothetical protein
MPVRSLPPRPDLDQLKRQARELLRDHADGKVPAAARIAAHHPRLRDQIPAKVLGSRFVLADAQAVLAREYGFANWAALKQRVAVSRRAEKFKTHPGFDEAVAALKSGDVARLRVLIENDPGLVHARTNLDPPHHYFTGATLLHHVAGNPTWEGAMPSNIVEVARLLLEAGADVDAMTLGPNAGTTMGLVVTSKQASDANVSGPLMDLLLKHGARLDLKDTGSVVPEWKRQDVLDLPLANHAPPRR